jgi:hypothetical protein
MQVTYCRRGVALPGTKPLAGWLLRKLAYQLAPAAIVTIVGVLLLGSLAKTPDAAPDAKPVATAIDGDAIFRMTPREPAKVEADDQDAKPTKALAARPAVKPKPVVANAAPQTRPAVNLPAPLPIVPVQPPLTAATAPPAENTIMGTLRNATAAVTQMPQRAARSVASWFAESAPPRPPAAVPVRDFQASVVLQ